jgi:hypothetical protein
MTPGPLIKLPIPSNIPFPILFPIPCPSISMLSNPLFNRFSKFSIVGPKDIFPTSDPTLVKLTKVLLINEDNV